MKHFHTVRTRIFGGFAALIILQIGVAALVWRAEDQFDVAKSADDTVEASAGLIGVVSINLRTVQLRLSHFVRTGSAADRELVDTALAALGKSIGQISKSDNVSVRLGESITLVRSELADVLVASLLRRDDMFKMTQTANGAESALTALAQAASKAAERATVEAVATIVATALHPLVFVQRYANGADDLDAQAVLTSSAKSKEALQSLLKEGGDLPPRLQRLIGAVTASLDELPPAMEKFGKSSESRNKSLTQLDAAALQASRILNEVRAKLDAERGVYRAQIVEARDQVRTTVMVAGGVSGLIGAALAVLVGLSITRPIVRLASAMRRIAGGSLEVDVPDRLRRDEIGGMANAVQVFKDNMIQTTELTARQESMKLEAQAAQKAAMNQTADDFEAKVGGLVGVLSSAAADLEATAQGMSGTALQTTGQAATVAAAAEEASVGAETVAAAAEQLTASIREISRQVAHSSKITSQAVEDAQRTNAIVHKLDEGAEKIGKVVALISNIAGQTNLLALNATIEAARAGDAGKGFAVVASEVKSLANQTALATQEIGTQIAEIQAATREAVEAIRGISGTIDDVSAIATNIASAVDQQGAATAEIARNVQQTARSAHDVTENIGGVSQAATHTGAAAGQLLDAAGRLSRQAEQLTTEVGKFISEVRAA